MKKYLFLLLSLPCLLLLSSCGQSANAMESTATTAHVHISEEAVQENVLEATCLEAGSYEEVIRCQTCREELSRKSVTQQALGHNYQDKKCLRCGAWKPSEGLSFRSNGNGTCALSGIGSCQDEDIIIPERSPAGDTVTEIAAYAFPVRVGLRSVRMPDTVTSIGNDAFYYCSTLETVVFSDNLKSLGIGIFAGCDSLKFNVSKDLCYVGSTSNPYFVLVEVKNKTLQSYEIEADTVFLNSHAFSFCKSVTRLVIPDQVVSIGAFAFQSCEELESVILPKGLTVISDSLFMSCRKLQSIKIPEGVTKIEPSAFAFCSNLKTVELPIGLESIGESAFYFCAELSEVTLPNSVKTLGNEVFRDCAKLRSLTLSQGLTAIPEGMIRNCTALESLVIPSTVKSIGPSAFYNCRGITSMRIPTAVKTIGVDAFKMSGIQYLFFDKTTGWMRCGGPLDTAGEPIERLEDPAWAAMTINVRFNDYTWKRR